MRGILFPEGGKMGRSAVFIDGAYIEFLIREEFAEMRVDFARLSQRLAGTKELLRTYYYHCLPYQGANPTEEETKRYMNKLRFFRTLDRLPRFEVRLAASGQITDAILVASDSNLVPAVAAAKECGVLVTLFHGRKAGANEDLW